MLLDKAFLDSNQPVCIEPDLSPLEGLKAAVDTHLMKNAIFVCQIVCSNYILNFAVSVFEKEVNLYVFACLFVF